MTECIIVTVYWAVVFIIRELLMGNYESSTLSFQ